MQLLSVESLRALKSDVLWDVALKETLELFGCSTGTIHSLSQEDGLLHVLSHQGIPEHILPAVAKIPVGKGIAGAAAERREPVEICNLQQDDGGVAKAAARDTKVSGSVAVPIESSNGELLGTLGIGKFEPYDFSEDEKAQLTQIASQLAELLER